MEYLTSKDCSIDAAYKILESFDIKISNDSSIDEILDIIKNDYRVVIHIDKNDIYSYIEPQYDTYYGGRVDEAGGGYGYTIIESVIRALVHTKSREIVCGNRKWSWPEIKEKYRVINHYINKIEMGIYKSIDKIMEFELEGDAEEDFISFMNRFLKILQLALNEYKDPMRLRFTKDELRLIDDMIKDIKDGIDIVSRI